MKVVRTKKSGNSGGLNLDKAPAIAPAPNPANPVPTPQPGRLITNVTAVSVELTYNNGEKLTKTYWGKLDKFPVEADQTVEQAPVPITAKMLYAKNDLVTNSVSNVTIAGNSVIQPLTIKSITKADTTSTVTFEAANPSSIVVYFGFFNKAGIVKYSIFEKDTTNYFLQDETVDLHSSSNSSVVEVRGVEIASELDSSKTYIVQIKHSGTANPNIFDNSFEHRIYVADIIVNRIADASRSVVENVSNTAFLNTSYATDGSKNSLTGRPDFAEFFEVQIENADGITDSYRIKTPTIRIRSVEIDNGRGFEELDDGVDWVTTFGSSEEGFNDTRVQLSFIPKSGAIIRIQYDTYSFGLQRRIDLSQPITTNGLYDRFANVYVQNEAIFNEISANDN